MQESKYPADLTNYGFLTGAKDPQTQQPKPPQFFATFAFVDEQNINQTQTYFNGFKEIQPGKQTSQKEMTLKTIELLGYNGTQIAGLAAGAQSGMLNTQKKYEIELEFSRDQMGNVQQDDKGNPKFRIKWVNDPENSGFKNKMTAQDAAVIIGGLNLDADMMTLKNGQNGGSGGGGGYDVQNGHQNNNQNNNNNNNNNGHQNNNNNNNQNNQNNNQQNMNMSTNNGHQNNNNNGAGPNFNNNNNQNNGHQNNNNNQNNNQQNNQNMGFDNQGNPPF